MASLVAALGLVLVSMNEASKPATWEHLGFGGKSQQASSILAARELAQVTPKVAPTQRLVALRGQLAQFDLRELTTLDQVTRAIRTKNLDDTLQTVAIPILERMVDDLAASEDSDAASLTDANAILNAAQSVGQDVDETLLDRFAAMIFKRSLEFVEDRTTMNRSIESLAWNLAWESSSEGEEENAVSYLQLAGQPEAYRGKSIVFNAQIRGIEKIRLNAKHRLSIDAYYVYWMKPIDSGHTPYCVYSAELLTGLDAPGNQFVHLKKEVRVKGRFFKLRSYEASNQQVEICPLIVAHQISVPPNQTAASESRWSPPNWLVVTFLIGMPLIAIGMAYSVFRSTAVKRRKYDASSINRTLSNLARDKKIKSELEQLKELSESES